MKKLVLSILFTAIAYVAMCQIENPVKLTYSAKKINATTYELRISADLEEDWHIYSQTTPEGGPIPTSISFSKNPLISFVGETKEQGKLEETFEKMFGVVVKQFNTKVNFVQVIKLKSPVKTNISGVIKYMACNNEKCLPPATKSFSIAIK